MLNFDVVKVGLEMMSISSICFIVQHGFSNAIQCHPIVQVFEWPSFDKVYNLISLSKLEQVDLK
jgi:hypothetical protein